MKAPPPQPIPVHQHLLRQPQKSDHPPPPSQQMEAVRDRGELEEDQGARTQGQASVLHFLSKLRRHASLEGAGPYFKRWKFDSSHRAASLDAKGSVERRRPF